MKKKYLFIIILVFLLSGCQNNEPISKSAFLLDTIITIQIYDSDDESLLDEAIDICEYYESLWSKTIESSEISLINNSNGATITVSDETIYLLETALYYSNLSNGAFDITVKPLSDLWDFTGSDPSVPGDEDIQEVLKDVDYTTIQITENEVTLLNSNGSIDVGALAKGYISDQIKIYLEEQGVTSAIINLGGNVLTIGKNTTGNGFSIAVQEPFGDSSDTIGYLEIEDLSVVTSGIYERCFIEDDIIYHHLLNPTTGYPFDNDLLSVTIISSSSLDGDALSTTCFALGTEKALELIESIEGVEAIFITKDNKIIETTDKLLKQ